ncbi:MAG: cyclic nucleotide-binding domain-containing protein [Lachnospiraceae bacterium]|nr:cyclic nucleotide-binding domain-containing protein [Lachnospiraceae bacterium]
MLTNLPGGTVILKEKEINMDMYKILSGHVEIYINYGTEKETILGILSKGAYFGEIGLFTQKPAIYTVVAYSDVVLRRITDSEIEDYISQNTHDMLAIIHNMANTMYNLKFNMDLALNDIPDEKQVEDVQSRNKQIIKDHLQGMTPEEDDE